MSTTLETKSFYRLKAAMHDLIDRAGGIERAADVCGYSKSAVGRWHCRHADDLMPIAAVLALEIDSGSPLVTRTMCGLHGLECTTAASDETHVMNAYVDVTAKTAGLNGEVAAAMADGVMTPAEITRIEKAASDTAQAVETLRGSLASASGKPLRVVGA